MTRIFVLSVVAVMMVSSLSACGRKGAPESPPGSSYPSSYPTN